MHRRGFGNEKPFLSNRRDRQRECTDDMKAAKGFTAEKSSLSKLGLWREIAREAHVAE
jgi:hypothetical protein